MSKRSFGWGVLSGLALYFGWSRFGDVDSASARPVDPVRLSLTNATLYQYGADGKQASQLSSAELQRLTNGDTLYFAPRLWQKIATAERQVSADYAEQRAGGGEIFLRGTVKAQQIGEGQTFAVQTSSLRYSRAENVVETDAPVFFQSRDVHGHADGVKWLMTEQRFIFKKNIRSVYEPTP